MPQMPIVVRGIKFIPDMHENQTTQMLSTEFFS